MRGRYIRMVGLLLISMLMTTITGCEKGNVTGDKKKLKNDNVILATKENDEFKLDLYIKHPDNEMIKVGEDVDRYGVAYLDESENIFFKDSIGNLYLKNGDEKINIASSLENFRIAIANIIAVQSVPFKVAKDKSAIAFTTTEGDLYIRKNDNEKQKISSELVANYILKNVLIMMEY